MNFPREKHQSNLVAMSAVVSSVSVLHGRGCTGALFAATAAEDSRAPPLFATEPTRFHTENRTQGAHYFFNSKNSLQFHKVFLYSLEGWDRFI